MSDVFFAEMRIPEPRHHLGIGGGTHGQNTGRMLEAIEGTLLLERPDLVIVYGDTDSTLAGALAAAKLKIPVAHVEAGLRSFRRDMPEEINRIVTDHLSSRLYAPSAGAVAQLEAEGISRSTILQCGDVMYDVVLRFADLARSRSDVVERLGLTRCGYHLVTLHRQANTDDRAVLAAILEGLGRSSVQVVFPVHPRTKRRLEEFGLELPPNVRALEPQGYLDTIRLIMEARRVATDSGGVQKEAYFLGKPCVTLREETEWTELVECGANVLVGASVDQIAEALAREDWSLPRACIYGDGNAAALIAHDIAEFLG